MASRPPASEAGASAGSATSARGAAGSCCRACGSSFHAAGRGRGRSRRAVSRRALRRASSWTTLAGRGTRLGPCRDPDEVEMHLRLLSVSMGARGALPSERAAGEVGDQLRRRGVEADDVEHARVVRVGDREAVRDHADHDQPRVDARRAAVVARAPGPGGCRPPRSPSRCRSRTCRSPARAPARTASAARSRCRRTAGRDTVLHGVVQPLPRA